MKKLMMLIVTAFAAAVSLVADTGTVGNYTYNYIDNGDGTVTLSRYDDNGNWVVNPISPTPTGEFEVPSEIDGKQVVGIGDGLFRDSQNITSVIIPASVTNIGNRVFHFSYGLTNISVEAENPAYRSIDGILYSKDGRVLVCCPYDRRGEIVIAEGTEIIGSGAFENNRGVESVVFPVGLIQMGDYAFWNCNELKDIAFPTTVTTVGNSAFGACYAVTNIVLNEGLLSIGYGAFGNRTANEITLPTTVTDIRTDAFICDSGDGGEVLVNAPWSLYGVLESEELHRTWYVDETEPHVVTTKVEVVFYGDAPSFYAVGFDVNGGDALSENERSIMEGRAIGSLPVPTRSGYVFCGWFTAAAGGDEVAAETVVTGDMTLYAHWTESPFYATGGGAPWLIDGDGSWRSGAITDSQSTWVELAVTNAPCLVSFKWKTSSEDGYDILHCYLDGDEIVSAISGVMDEWVNVSFAVAESGDHSVQFEYTKDGSASNGEDCGWVKDFALIEAETRALTLDANGGWVSGGAAVGMPVINGCAIGRLPVPVWTGDGARRFVGWFTMVDGGDEVLATTIVAEEVITIYAHWRDINPPTNDNFVDAIEIQGVNGTANGTNIDATTEDYFCAEEGDVWWKWTAPVSGKMSFEVRSSRNMGFLIGILTGNTLDSLDEIACEDDDDYEGLCRVEFDAEAGTTYHILVGGSGTTYGDGQQGLSRLGDFTLSWRQLLPPENDAFANATVISGESGKVIGTNMGAGIEEGEPLCAYAYSTATAWWSWTAPKSGSFVFDTNGSDFDTVLGVYTGNAVAGLEIVDENDDDDNGSTSTIIFDAVAGKTYYIAVGGCENCIGNIVLNWNVPPVGEWLFDITENGEAIITGNSVVLVGDVVIPASVTVEEDDGEGGVREVECPVVAIGEKAFYCSGLASVTMPGSVTSIGERAFSDCYSLATVTIPANVTNIGYGAYYGCDNLTDACLPKALYSSSYVWDFFEDTVDIHVYSGSVPAFFTVTLNVNGGMALDESEISVFEGEGIALPTPEHSDDMLGFSGWYTAAEGGERVTDLTAFYRNATIYAHWGVYEPELSYNWEWIWDDEDELSGHGVLCVAGCVDDEFDGELVIPSRIVCSIGDAEEDEDIAVSEVTGIAWLGDLSITSIVVPASVIYVGEDAFGGCDNLTSVSVPSCCMPLYCFFPYDIITNVVVCDGVGKIAREAFSGCECLESVTLPASVTSIDDYAFNDCSSLSSVTIPDSVTNIGEGALAGCSSLRSVTIPVSVTNIGEGAFYCGENLTEAYLPKALEDVLNVDDVFDPYYTVVYFYSGNEPTFYTITLNVNGGETLDKIEFVRPGGSSTRLLPIPERKGCRFIGWFTAAEGGMQMTAETVVAGDMTLYAHWAEFNDEYECAQIVEGTSGSVQGTNIGAGVEDGEPLPREFESTATVWWKWTAPKSGICVFDTQGSSFDTVLGVYAGSAVDKLETVADNDDQDVGSTSRVEFEVAAGKTYYIAVGGYSTCIGNIVLSWSCNEVVIPELDDDNPSSVTNAIEKAGFADAAVKAAIGESAEEYNAFKAWAGSVKGATGDAPAGEAAVVANTHAAAAYLLGAERLFENEPAVEIDELAVAEGESAGTTAMTVAVTVKDGESAVAVSAAKVAAMFEATGDLGDWNGAAKLTPMVTISGTDASGKMTFVVTPGDGTAAKAFLRIKR